MKEIVEVETELWQTVPANGTNIHLSEAKHHMAATVYTLSCGSVANGRKINKQSAADFSIRCGSHVSLAGTLKTSMGISSQKRRRPLTPERQCLVVSDLTPRVNASYAVSDDLSAL
jgi:hypothetical protein